MRRKTRPDPTAASSATAPIVACPCGQAAAYADCCGRHHTGTPTPTAEALMRSRYSAYALGLADYLLATWAAETRPNALDLTAAPQPKWIGLTVLAQAEHGHDATVEFVARCKINGRAERMHEKSRFVKRRDHDEWRWYYLDGELTPGE